MKTQNKIYSTAAVFIIISLILIVFLIYPTFKDIKRGSEEILSDKKKTAFIYMQNQELDDFRKNFENYEADLSKIEKLFVNPKNPVDFIKFLENTSSNLNTDVEISLVVDKKKQAADNPPFSYFKVYAEGDFQNILKLSESLEKGPYLLQINNLSINKLILDIENKKKSSNAVAANFIVQVINK